MIETILLMTRVPKGQPLGTRVINNIINNYSRLTAFPDISACDTDNHHFYTDTKFCNQNEFGFLLLNILALWRPKHGTIDSSTFNSS